MSLTCDEPNVAWPHFIDSDLGLTLQLPSQLRLSPLVFRLSTPGSLAEDLAWLQESFAFDLGEGAAGVCAPLRGWGVGSVADLGLRPGALLGVDTEGGTSLVQLATASRGCIFRLRPCCAEPTALAALAALMADETVG